MAEDATGHVTIIGLGPGTWESLTLEAADAMRSTREVWVRTAVQPFLEPISSHLPEVTFHSFDNLYDTLPTLTDVYTHIVDCLSELAVRPQGVVYAVPGSAVTGETTVRMLQERMAEKNVPVRLVPGLSFVESVLTVAGVTDAPWVQVIDAAEIAMMADANALGEVTGEDQHLPWSAPNPTIPTLISFLFDRRTASGIKLWLGRYYPDDHRLLVVRAPGTPWSTAEPVRLFELDRFAAIDHSTALYVPPLEPTDNRRTFAGIMEVTRRLRAPGGCPWDREQTHQTLKPHLLEETYEVLDALDAEDPHLLAEELGDLLFQITIHSQIASEHENFSIEDVIQGITTKLVGRHPHVFGDMQLDNAQDVREAWESFKQKEKPKRASILEQIPRGLPALPQSNLMQKRAASVGFEWPGLQAVIDKVEEEIRELQHEVDTHAPKEEQREEFGDILFALVSMARHLRIDPEEALRLANRKFAARFQYVESRVSALGKTLKELTPAELDAYWEEAKALGSARWAHPAST